MMAAIGIPKFEAGPQKSVHELCVNAINTETNVDNSMSFYRAKIRTSRAEIT